MDSYDIQGAVDYGITAYRSAVDGTDSTTIDTPLSPDPRHALNRRISGTALNVATRFSDTLATATLHVTFWVYKEGEWSYLFLESLDFTGSALDDEDGNFPSDDKGIADNGGATHYNVLCVAAPSAGTINIHAWNT